MTGKIFINYRRGDDPGSTGWLRERLESAFHADRLFMDVDSIAPGLDFVRVIEEQVDSVMFFWQSSAPDGLKQPTKQADAAWITSMISCASRSSRV